MFEPLVFVAQGDGVGVTSGVGIARESVLKLNQLTPVLVRSTTLTNTSGVGIARESVPKLNGCWGDSTVVGETLGKTPRSSVCLSRRFRASG